MTTTFLESLPTPQVLESASLKSIRDSVLSTFIDLEPSYELLIASDPAVKVLDVYAFRDWLLRVRIDSAVKSTFLRYATGANLDNVAGNLLITRLTDETDTDFRDRVQKRGPNPSTAGPKTHYEFFAKSVSSDIKDVNVYSPSEGNVEVAVLSSVTLNNGVPTTTLLNLVNDAVQAAEVRVMNDTVTVVGAERVVQDITVTIKLQPDTVETVFTNMETLLEAAYVKFAGLGKDLTRSWLIDQLHTDGVHSVDLTVPATDVSIADNQFFDFGTITLTQGARTL